MFPSLSCHVRMGELFCEFGSTAIRHVKLKEVYSSLTTFDGRMIVVSSAIYNVQYSLYSYTSKRTYYHALTNYNNGSSVHRIRT